MIVSAPDRAAKQRHDVVGVRRGLRDRENARNGDPHLRDRDGEAALDDGLVGGDDSRRSAGRRRCTRSRSRRRGPSFRRRD